MSVDAYFAQPRYVVMDPRAMDDFNAASVMEAFHAADHHAAIAEAREAWSGYTFALFHAPEGGEPSLVHYQSLADPNWSE